MRAFCRTIVGARRRVLWGLAFVLVGIGVLACRGERAARERDSVRVSPSVPGEDSMVTMVRVWDSAIGKLMVLSVAEFPDSVMILGPDYVQDRYSDSATFDLRGVSGTQVELFGRGGAFGTSVVTAGIYRRSDEGCVSWPTGAMLGGRVGWGVGLEIGRAVPVALDSIEGMRAADSTRFAVEITRIVAGMTETKDGTFSVVPFLVLRGYRYRFGGGDGIVGVVRRSIPSEADPREERVFFVAERGDGEEYRVVFVDREVGDGEAPRSVDVLAMVRLRDGREVIVVSYIYNDGGSIGIVEARGVGVGRQWDGTWESAYVGC